jgi:hypothetical protein
MKTVLFRDYKQLKEDLDAYKNNNLFK